MHTVSIPSPRCTDSCELADETGLSRDEVQRLRDILRDDEPAFDECPTLEDALYRGPSSDDELWWLSESLRNVPSGLDLWLDDACPDDPEPCLSDDRTGAAFGGEVPLW